jgi:hypothetical protein
LARARAQEILANDGSVDIKGCDADEAVLTTRDKSYTVRLADSSNTILLVRGAVELSLPADAVEGEVTPTRTAAGVRTLSRTGATDAGEPDCTMDSAAPVPPPIEIQARVHEHFELVRCAPRLGRAHALLAACLYAGAAADEELCQAMVTEEALAPYRPEMRPTLEQLEREAQCAATATPARARPSARLARALPQASRAA